MRKLQLIKPICFFDLETTGINVFIDKIVSIAIKKVYPDGTFENFYKLINPGIPIPESATAIHGITNEMVKSENNLDFYKDVIMDFFDGSDIGGFNSNVFDIPLLSIELERFGVTFPHIDAKFVDVCNLFKKLNPRDLNSAMESYLGISLKDAHNAQADNDATFSVFQAMIEKHEDLPLTVDEISKISDHGLEKVDIMGKFTYNEKGEYVINFGQHKGKRANMDTIGFIGWMLQPGRDFHPNTIMWARKIYDKVINSK